MPGFRFPRARLLTGRLLGERGLQPARPLRPVRALRSTNAHRYGFTYEPWHVRYLGPDVAQKLFDAGITLEEHAGFPAAPGY